MATTKTKFTGTLRISSISSTNPDQDGKIALVIEADDRLSRISVEMHPAAFAMALCSRPQECQGEIIEYDR